MVWESNGEERNRNVNRMVRHGNEQIGTPRERKNYSTYSDITK